MPTNKVVKKPNKTTENIHLVAIWLIGMILILVPFLFTQSVFIGLIFSKTMLFYGLTTLLIVIYSILIYLDHRVLPTLNKIGFFWREFSSLGVSDCQLYFNETSGGNPSTGLGQTSFDPVALSGETGNNCNDITVIKSILKKAIIQGNINR